MLFFAAKITFSCLWVSRRVMNAYFNKLIFRLNLLSEHEFPTPQSRTPDLTSRHVASVFYMVCILSLDIFSDHFPSLPHRPMEATRCPHMLATPFLKMGKFFSLKKICTWSGLTAISIIPLPSSLHVLQMMPSVTIATSSVDIFPRYFGANTIRSVSSDAKVFISKIP